MRNRYAVYAFALSIMLAGCGSQTGSTAVDTPNFQSVSATNVLPSPTVDFFATADTENSAGSDQVSTQGGGTTQPADSEDPPPDMTAPNHNPQSGIYETIVTVTVTQVMPDGTGVHGTHQHLMIKLATGDVAFLAHNLGLAPRVPVQVGDAMQVRGEWIATGPQDPQFPNDVLHWTHHDPAHHHADGYILFQGKKYS